MKKILIKFRAVRSSDEKTIYGDLIHDGNDLYISADKFLFNATIFKVKPDSVSQLVGFDKNGAEIYEGDTVVYAGCQWIASLGGYVRNSSGLCHYNFKNVTLKENNYE